MFVPFYDLATVLGGLLDRQIQPVERGLEPAIADRPAIKDSMVDLGQL